MDTLETIKNRVDNIAHKVDTNNIMLPKSVKIELAAICNHKCSYCIVPKIKVKQSYILIDDFRIIMQELNSLGIKEIGLFHMGEGTLHPMFKGIIQYCTETFLDTRFFITTNGTQLEKLKYAVRKGINSIKFSLNGYNREKHKELVEVDDFDEIISNLKELVQYRNEIGSRTEISASSIFCPNKEAEEFATMISSIADNYYQTQIFNQAGQVDEDLEKPDKNKWVLPKLCEKPCFGLYNLGHIKVDGTINMCRFGTNDEFNIGHIKDGFKNAWFGPKAMEIRERCLNDQIETCKICLYGHK